MSIYKKTMKAASDNLLRMYPILFVANLLPLVYLFLFIGKGSYRGPSLFNYLHYSMRGIDSIIITLTFYNIYIVFMAYIVLSLLRNVHVGSKIVQPEILKPSNFISNFNNLFAAIILISFYVLLYFSVFSIAISFVSYIFSFMYSFIFGFGGSGYYKVFYWIFLVIKVVLICYFSIHLIYTLFLVYFNNISPVQAIKESKKMVSTNSKKIFIFLVLMYFPFFIIDVGIIFIQYKMYGLGNYAWLKNNIQYLSYIITPLKIIVMSFAILKLYERSIEDNKTQETNKGSENE